MTMSGRSARGLSREARVIAALWLPWIAALALSLWRTPFPINETIALLEDVRNATRTFFDPTIRAWYRPLFFYTFDWLWRGTGSLDSAMQLFKIIEIIAPVSLVLLFIRHLNPRGWLEAGAATVAVAILVGTPGFRQNLEIPLLMTLVGMPLLLLVWMILTSPLRAWHAVAVVSLTLIAIGYKEQGLAIAPAVVIAWWTRAPGADSRTAVGLVAATFGYLAFRFAWNANWPIFEQSMGLGFQTVEPRDAIAQFGAFPYWMYGYNALSTMLNVLVSEPTSGLFFIARDVAYSQVEPWEVVHVTSSVALTGLIAWWSWRVIPGWRRDGWTPEGRVALAFWVVLLGSGALSVKYSRDRLGGMAAVMYALAAYEALRSLASEARTTPAAGRRWAVMLAMVLTISIGWHLRAVGTLEWTRRMAESNYAGWMTQVPTRRVRFADRPVYLGIMSRMTPQGTAADSPRPTNYPDVITRLLGPPVP